jgi:hypothetical protein
VIDRTYHRQRATGGRARRTWRTSQIPFSTWLNRAANGICAVIYDGAAEFRCMASQWGVADNHVLLMDLLEAFRGGAFLMSSRIRPMTRTARILTRARQVLRRWRDCRP